jgi:hypothetical protein
MIDVDTFFTALYVMVDDFCQSHQPKRRPGLEPSLSDIGWSNSLGWYEGFRLLVAINPAGVITGFGFASASTKDQPLAETFFALRVEPDDRLASVGSAALGPYVSDKGFEGEENHRRWLDCYGARIICPPKRNERRRRWSKQLRRWAAGIRQIAETVYEKLPNTFGLRRERAHDMSRVAGTIGGQGCTAQLLHLAQRVSRSSPAGFRRLARMVISTHTKRLRDRDPILPRG